MGRLGCRHRCFGDLAKPWRLRARFNSLDASALSWTPEVSISQRRGAGRAGYESRPRERGVSAPWSGKGREWRRQRAAVCAGGTEREKVETGAQGGADTEELSMPSGSEG